MNACVYQGLVPMAHKPETRISDVLHAVQAATGFTLDELKSECRSVELVNARSATCVLLRIHAECSLPRIGKTLNRHHASVLHNLWHHTGRSNNQRGYKYLFAACVNSIYGNSDAPTIENIESRLPIKKKTKSYNCGRPRLTENQLLYRNSLCEGSKEETTK